MCHIPYPLMLFLKVNLSQQETLLVHTDLNFYIPTTQQICLKVTLKAKNQFIYALMDQFLISNRNVVITQQKLIAQEDHNCVSQSFQL